MDLEAILGAETRRWIPVLAVVVGSALALALGHRLLTTRAHAGEWRVARQLIMAIATAVALVLAILTLPVSDTTRGQLLSLLGVVLTGVIAFSSTTFVSNAMAGLMLRAVGNFKPGDFVRVEGHFGRVSERGLFHTEIQTEDRDLTTLPNLYLVTHPVAVVRASGTIVSATLSLGYDVAHARVEPLLKQAAEQAELQEPFVQVLELGDFSVTYRAAGFLPDVQQILTARSRLRTRVLDVLHGAGIEIVSPTFMNQRRLAEDVRMIPTPVAPPRVAEKTAPEERIFDKAALAGEVETLRAEQTELAQRIAELERELRSVKDEATRARLEAELARGRARAEAVEEALRAQGEAAKS